MLRFRFCTLLLLCSPLLACVSPPKEFHGPPPPPLLKYKVSHQSEDNRHRILVDLEFTGSSEGRTTLILPTTLETPDKPFVGLQDLHVVAGGTLEDNPNSPIRRRILHMPDAPVHIRYTLEPNADSNSALIRQQFFYFNGSLLAHPEFSVSAARVQLHWSIPPSWKIANSFGFNQLNQTFFGSFDSNPAENILQSAFAAGDLRLHQIEIQKRPVVFAIRGQWRIPDEDFLGATAKIIRTQRAFWNDHSSPYYLVLLLSNDKACCARGGRGFTHSLVAFLSQDEYSLDRFSSLLAHEHFHLWNGQKMAPRRGSELWFTEGFTDYFARALNLRAGLIRFPEFVDGFNSALYRYYENPQREASGERIEADFSNSADIAALIDAKGNVLAAEWNAVIKRVSQGKRSLDDLMKSVYRKSRATPESLSRSIIQSELVRLTDLKTATNLMQMAQSGALIKPSRLALGPCARLDERETGLLQYGYDRNAGDGLVHGVERKTAAHKAGLREGQEILEKREEWFKPWTPVEIKIRSKNKIRWISYLPQSKETLKYPYFTLKKQSGCAKAML